MPSRGPVRVDGASSSADVFAAQPTFAILPIGSCEQHGRHLPLLTDTRIVEHVAGRVGERLGGFILPTLPYGTSYEHVGFAGTVTLRWPTLAHVVEDIVESVNEQGITTVFVLSGHGGNFILNPCVRDLNRRATGGRRVVLVPEPVLLGSEGAGGEADLHAGAWETSAMLALAPGLVDMTSAVDEVPEAARWALTNDPMVALSASGVWGRPGIASAESGGTLLDAAVERVTAFVAASLPSTGR